MAEKSPKAADKEGGAERASRVLRNLNAIGAVALGGAAMIAPAAAVAPLAVLSGVNAVQAGGFEAVRRNRKNKRKSKQ